MSSLTKIDIPGDEDRLATWRNERYEKGLQDKEDRIKAKEIQKQSQAELAKLERQQAARALLPTDKDLEDQERTNILQNQKSSWRSFGLFVFCVILPFLAGAYYLFAVATPLYEARTIVVVSKGSSTQDAQRAGLLNSLSTSPNLQDLFMANAFVNSQAIMEVLETGHGTITRWSGDEIDPLLRLRPIPSIGVTKQMQLDRFIKSDVDIQTGLLTIVVRDPDQLTATATADIILAATEDRLNELNNAQFDLQISRAQTAVETARSGLLAAQDDLAILQASTGEVDPRLRVTGIYETIRQLEGQALELESEVQKSEIAGRGDSFLTSQTRQLAELTRAKIEASRSLLVEGKGETPSLNNVLLDYERATLRLHISEEALENAFDNLATVSQSAADNQSLLQVIVPPQSSAVPMNANGLPALLLIGVLSLALFAFLRVLQVGRNPEFS